MIVITKDQPKALEELLERAETHQITYREQGRTQSDSLPSGYQHDHLSAPVGSGDAAWSRAQDAIRQWRGHEHAGIRIMPTDASIDEGSTIVASWSVGPVLLVAPCRLVYTTMTPIRFGFAYGTLPGHPEQGEEAFHVSLNPHGEVTAEIVAFSRPSDRLTRLAGPVARLIQKAVIRRYVEGVAGFVRKGG